MFPIPLTARTDIRNGYNQRFRKTHWKDGHFTMSDIQWREAVLEGNALDGVFGRFKCWYSAKDVNNPLDFLLVMWYPIKHWGARKPRMLNAL